MMYEPGKSYVVPQDAAGVSSFGTIEVWDEDVTLVGRLRPGEPFLVLEIVPESCFYFPRLKVLLSTGLVGLVGVASLRSRGSFQ